MHYEKLKQFSLHIVNYYNQILMNVVTEYNKISNNKIDIKELENFKNDNIYQIEQIDKPNKGESLCVYDFVKDSK